MTRARTWPRGDDRTAAFSLLEVMLVLAVLALVLYIGMSAITTSRSSANVRSLGLSIAAELRALRSSAVAHNRANAFTFNAQAHAYLAGNDGHTTRLPDDFGMKLTGARKTRRSGGQASIIFFPDGSSSGGAILVWRDRVRVRITVDWLTGNVTMAEAPG